MHGIFADPSPPTSWKEAEAEGPAEDRSLGALGFDQALEVSMVKWGTMQGTTSGS